MKKTLILLFLSLSAVGFAEEETLFGDIYVTSNAGYTLLDQSSSGEEGSDMKITAAFADSEGHQNAFTAYTFEDYGNNAYYELKEEKILSESVPVEVFYASTESADDGENSYTESYTYEKTAEYKLEKTELITDGRFYYAESKIETYISEDETTIYEYSFEQDDGAEMTYEYNYEQIGESYTEVSTYTTFIAGKTYEEYTEEIFDSFTGETTILNETMTKIAGKSYFEGYKNTYNENGILLSSAAW